MARSRHHDDGWTPGGTCPECGDKDPQRRTLHHLRLVQVADLDVLRAHLTEQYVYLREQPKQRPDLVDDTCQWVSGLIAQWSNLPDPVTGAPMPWWQARQQMANAAGAMAESCRAAAPPHRPRPNDQSGERWGHIGTLAAEAVEQGQDGTPFGDEDPYPVPTYALGGDDDEEDWQQLMDTTGKD